MSHHLKFVKDIGIVGIAQLLTNVRGLIFIPILTKFLGAEQYGIWAQFYVTLNFITPFALLNLPTALIRFLPGAKNKEEIQEQTWSTNFLVLGITLCISIFLSIFAKQISGILQIPAQLIFLLGVLVILQSLGFLLSSILQALQEVKKLAFFIIGVPVAEIIFVSFAILSGFALYQAILALVIARGIMLFILFIAIIKRVGLKVPNFSRMKEYLGFSLPMVMGNLSYLIVQIGDHYLIGIMLGILFVGYYAPAYSVGFMLNMFTLPVGMILPALLAKLFAENKLDEIKQYLRETFKYLFFILIPAVFGLSILSKQILAISTTQDIALHSSWVLPVIASSFLFFAAYGIFAQVLYLFKKTAFIGIVWIGAAVLNIVLNLLFIPPWGITGAAFATFLSYFALFAATWLYSARYLSFSFPLVPLLKSFLASFIMSAFLLVLGPESLPAVLFAILGGAMLYGALLFLFKAIGRNEIRFLAKLFERI